MAFGAAPSPTSLPGVVSAGEEQSLIAFVTRYLGVWGLVDASRAERAASRVIAVALASNGEAQSPRERRRRILFLTRKWVEEFARGASGSSDDWLWRAQSLLARYPRAFLATPIPSGRTTGEAVVSLLPAPEPRPMMQQTITDSFERLSDAVREVVERVKGARSIAEPERIVQPSS